MTSFWAHTLPQGLRHLNHVNLFCHKKCTCCPVLINSPVRKTESGSLTSQISALILGTSFLSTALLLDKSNIFLILAHNTVVCSSNSQTSLGVLLWTRQGLQQVHRMLCQLAALSYIINYWSQDWPLLGGIQAGFLYPCDLGLLSPRETYGIIAVISLNILGWHVN